MLIAECSSSARRHLALLPCRAQVACRAERACCARVSCRPLTLLPQVRLVRVGQQFRFPGALAGRCGRDRPTGAVPVGGLAVARRGRDTPDRDERTHLGRGGGREGRGQECPPPPRRATGRTWPHAADSPRTCEPGPAESGLSVWGVIDEHDCPGLSLPRSGPVLMPRARSATCRFAHLARQPSRSHLAGARRAPPRPLPPPCRT